MADNSNLENTNYVEIQALKKDYEDFKEQDRRTHQELHEKVNALRENQVRTDERYSHLIEAMGDLKNSIKSDIKSLSSDIEEIKSRPMKRVDRIWMAVATACAGAFAGWIIAVLFGG